MKTRSFALILAAILMCCFVMPGCKSKDNGGQNISVEKTELEKATEKAFLLTEYIKDKRYADVVSSFGGALKESIGVQELEDTIKGVTFGLGELMGISGDSHAEHFDEYVVVTTTLMYENNGLTLKYTFDKDLVLQGFFCNYSGIPYDTSKELVSDKYKEIKLVLGEHKLEGILTLPSFIKSADCVVMVQGSGASDMDETIGAAANKPFSDIAHSLGENGIASVRFNKRYFQYPELAGEEVTINDEVLEDVYAAISFAYDTGYVNPQRIFILGHSMGGMLAPKIAYDNPRVAGIIIMAGTPRSLADVLYDQNIDAINADKSISEEEKEKAAAELEVLKDKANNAKENGNEKPFGIADKYWHSINEATDTRYLLNTNKPMLIIQGSEDFQIKADTDFAKYKELLKGYKNVSFRLYDGLNHLFMKTNGKTDLTEYNIKGRVDAVVVSDIIDFIANSHKYVKDNGTTESEKQEEKLPEEAGQEENTDLQKPDKPQQGGKLDFSQNQDAGETNVIVDGSDISESFFD